MSGISAVGSVGFPTATPAPASALPGGLAVAVDTAVLDAALLQHAAVYQLLKVDGAQALQVLKGVPPALGQHLDVSI
jgi:hypothetical protein